MTLTNVPNFTEMGGWMAWTNQVSDGYFGPLSIVLVFGVSYAILTRFNTATSMPACLFVTTIYAGLLSAMDIVSNYFFFVPLALLVMSVLWARSQD